MLGRRRAGRDRRWVRGGQVRGHWSVFFMLQIRSRCQWDYSAGVISHTAAPPPRRPCTLGRHAQEGVTGGRGWGGLWKNFPPFEKWSRPEVSVNNGTHGSFSLIGPFPGLLAWKNMEQSLSPVQIFKLSDSESIKVNSKTSLSQRREQIHACVIQWGSQGLKHCSAAALLKTWMQFSCPALTYCPGKVKPGFGDFFFFSNFFLLLLWLWIHFEMLPEQE